MRTAQEILDLILKTAENDERIRAVVMNGSRTNPNTPRDIFQDFDIVYLVTEVASFKQDPHWIERFGERMIMQLPDDMNDPPPDNRDAYAYLMQFMDGNRIDLTIRSLASLREMDRDSLSMLLLDKDGIVEPFAPPTDNDYLPKPPTAKAFFDCCNEFWWVCPYAAKGLWRQEISYAKHIIDYFLREQLMKMLAWYVGIKFHFSKNPGKFGKYLDRYLEPGLWEMLLETYSDAAYQNTWHSLETMCELFRRTALPVAEHFGYDYPHGDDQRVSAHLRYVRALPGDAVEMY